MSLRQAVSLVPQRERQSGKPLSQTIQRQHKITAMEQRLTDSPRGKRGLGRQSYEHLVWVGYSPWWDGATRLGFRQWSPVPEGHRHRRGTADSQQSTKPQQPSNYTLLLDFDINPLREPLPIPRSPISTESSECSYLGQIEGITMRYIREFQGGWFIMGD